MLRSLHLYNIERYTGRRSRVLYVEFPRTISRLMILRFKSYSFPVYYLENYKSQYSTSRLKRYALSFVLHVVKSVINFGFPYRNARYPSRYYSYSIHILYDVRYAQRPDLFSSRRACEMLYGSRVEISTPPRLRYRYKIDTSNKSLCTRLFSIKYLILIPSFDCTIFN